MYKATVNVTLRDTILDPEGKAASHALNNLGHSDIKDVRIGKLIELNIDADSQKSALKKAESACEKLLVNDVMENFDISISEI